MCWFSPYTNYVSAYNPSDVIFVRKCEMWILAICFLVVTELLGLVGIEQTAWAPEPVRCMRKGCGCVDFL